MERVHLVVRGRVQGVGFRWFVQRRAQELGISGWVRNQPDGSVEAEAEGSAQALAQLIEALREGPPRARVEQLLEAHGEGPARHHSFTISG